MQVLDASDGDLAPYTLHPHDDVQESEVGENEKDGDGGETSVCGGYGRYIWGVDDVCSDGGRSSGCRDTGGGEGDADDGGSSNGDENDCGIGNSSDWGQRYGGDSAGSDIVPNAHNKSGRAPHNPLSQSNKLTVVRFIKNNAAVHALSSAAIPNPPTGGDVHVLMPEDPGADNSCSSSLRRKHKSRPELIYAYKCSECGNEYASYPALYLHRKRNHTMPPVTQDGSGGDGSGGVTGDGSGGVTGDALPVAVDSFHDEGKLKSKLRHLSETDRTFSCTECDRKYGSSAALYTHRKMKHSS
jgi:hypothetical protein